MKIAKMYLAIALGYLLFFAPCVYAAWDGKTATYDWYINADSLAGETKDNPFLISSESDLVGLAKLVCESVAKTSPHPNAFDGKYFLLMNDLDFNTVEGEKTNWSPIGNKRNPFRGYFMGNGHTIKNVNIEYQEGNSNLKIDVYSESKVRRDDLYNLVDDSKRNSLGIFGHIMHSSILNLKVENITINGGYVVGGLCGYASWSSLIKSCSVDGEVKGNGFVGGVCGFIENSCVIDSCQAYGTVISTKGKLSNGGICGLAQSKCTIKNCENYSMLLCDGAEYVGGICGLINLYGSIKQCVNAGEINVSGKIDGRFAGFGGICGVLGHSCTLDVNSNIGNLNIIASQGFAGGNCGLASEETVLTNCFNAGTIKGISSSIIGGICGMSYRTTTNSNINVGNIEGDCVKGGVIGCNYKDRSLITKCYYDKQMCPVKYGIGVLSIGDKKGVNRGTEKLPTTSIAGLFAKTFEIESWVVKDGVYPIQKGLAESEIAKLAAQPIHLNELDDITSVKSAFKANPMNEEIGWEVSDKKAAMIAKDGSTILLKDGLIDMILSNGTAKKVVTLNSTK